MSPEFTSNPLHFGWPFWVLNLTPSATNSDIEKAAREIDSKIQFQVPGADQFETPTGKQKRDSFLIREAKAALQDPNARVLAEFWYIDPTPTSEEATHNQVSTTAEQISKALGVHLWA